MLKKLRHKFAALTAPPPIEIEYRSLAEERKDWEAKTFADMQELREQMAYFITGQYSQPWGYNIHNANLNGLDLNHLDQDRSNLVSKEAAQFVMLGGSSFENVQMQDAQMCNVHFWGSKFTGCDLSRAQLPGADFRSDQTRYFMFMMDPFQYAHPFGKTTLDDVRLREAELRNAQFNGTVLKDVDFTGADLRSACFVGARLENIDFTGADLRDVDFTDVDVSTCKFGTAKVDRTIFTRNMVRLGQFVQTSGKPTMKSGLSPIQMRQLRQMRRTP